MRTAYRFAASFLALAVLAAPVAGVCAALVGVDDACTMQESHQAASCGHEEMVMTGCCSAESAAPAAEAILPGSSGDMDAPALAESPCTASAGDGNEAAVFACDGDPPPAVPRYRLYSALLL